MSEQLNSAHPYLVLHHEEFTWPRLSPATPVSSYLTVSPIALAISNLKSSGQEYSLLHLSSPSVRGVPGSYPARCPMVFGLSSSLTRSDCPACSIARPEQYSKECSTFGNQDRRNLAQIRGRIWRSGCIRCDHFSSICRSSRASTSFAVRHFSISRAKAAVS